ncbi:MAG: ASPIC/UnbV domain-containing protein, partial [Acidobacteriota bacterium]
AAGYLGRPVRGGHPRIFRNESRGPDAVRFVDASAQLGLRQPLTPMGMNIADVDLDGFVDLYLGTGEPALESLVPNVLYLNFGGVTFRDATARFGLGHLQKGHGVAFGDADGDGDVDLFHQLGGFFAGDAFANALFENTTTARAAHLTLLLEGRASNRFAVGARVTAVVRAGRSRRAIHALAGSGGSFGGNSLQVEMGLGRIDTIENVVVRWPRFGAGVDPMQHLGPLEADRRYRVIEGEAAVVDNLAPVRLGADVAPTAHHHDDSPEPSP